MKFASLKLYNPGVYIVFLFLLLSIPHEIFAQISKKRPGSLDSYNLTLLPPYRKDVSLLDSVVRYDFTVTMRDGVIIDCLKFVPLALPPAGGWPTVIMVHGYGDNKETLAGFCKAQAQYGYYTMTFSVRGQGNSGGLSNLISTVEMQDLLELINYVRSDAGPNPNKILIMGGSQGGALPFMAACNGAPVRTVISSVAPPNFASSWIENGSIKMTFLWTIEYTPDTARYTPLVDRMSNWVYANNRNKWDSLAYWLPKDRDFMNQVPNCKVPMLIEGSWQDKFFNADGIMQGLSLLNAPFSSYLGAVQGHGGDHSATEDIWHMQWFNDWFFYWLFDINNGILDAPKYQYASTVMPYSNNRWTFIHDSSPVPLGSVTSSLKLYFNRHNRLTYAPSANTYTASFNNSVSGGLTMLQAVNEEFTGPVFNSKFKKAQIYFETAPLPYDYKMAGTPKINLNYSSSANTFCQYNFQLYEVTPNGTKYFVNRLNFTDRYYVKGQKRIKNFKGQAHSHIFKAGNKIRVVVTNLDTAPTDSTFLGTNPFVLPVLNNGTNRILLNSSSYIDLPVIAPPSTTPLTVKGENAPYAYRLKQNYPNPFNPATVIEYSIASSGKVKLVVYDMLGREVKTLVNEFKEAGTHSVLFNAGDFSSGIYFYKISSGDFHDVKRMVFVK